MIRKWTYSRCIIHERESRIYCYSEIKNWKNKDWNVEYNSLASILPPKKKKKNLTIIVGLPMKTKPAGEKKRWKMCPCSCTPHPCSNTNISKVSAPINRSRHISYSLSPFIWPISFMQEMFWKWKNNKFIFQLKGANVLTEVGKKSQQRVGLSAESPRILIGRYLKFSNVVPI